MRGFSRRAALLGGASLLAGCQSITDTFDSWFGERKVPLRGERTPVLAVDRPLGADPADTRPVSLPPAVANVDWPQAGGTTNHAPGHPALGPGLRRVWSSGIGTSAAYRRRLVAPPLLADGAVYAMDAYGRVTALDAATGRERWMLDTRPRKDRDGALGGGLAFEAGTLYVVTGLAEAMSVNIADGTVGWRIRLPAPARGAPTVAGGRIFLPTTENQVLCIAASDGARQWTYRGQPTTTLSLGLPAPAVEGETVIIGLASGELVALRTTDGRVIWNEVLSSARGGGLADIAAVSALPVIDRERVFAAGLGGLVVALDLRSGRRLWEREVTVAETLWSAGDWVFLVSTGGDLACIGREDGRVRWLTALGRFENPAKKRDPITWGPPMLAGGRLLVAGSHGLLVEVNPADGEKTGTVQLGEPTTLAPAIGGGTLFLLTDEANVVALRGAG